VWPFKKRSEAPTSAGGEPSYTQVDITDGLNDNLRLGPEDWIETIPLNARVKNAGESPLDWGLLAVDAKDETIYDVASRLSRVREAMPFPDEGVYCPVCHIANTQIARLHTPCPRCGGPLLQFGWN
jgi:hypothetical protein